MRSYNARPEMCRAFLPLCPITGMWADGSVIRKRSTRPCSRLLTSATKRRSRNFRRISTLKSLASGLLDPVSQEISGL